MGYIFFSEIAMRYYEKPTLWIGAYSNTYECDHPLYSKCTLFEIGDKGLAVIQQRFDKSNKTTWWGPVDPWLADDIYKAPRFREYFDAVANCKDDNELYFTVPVRRVMRALGMKPLPKEYWETRF